MTHVRSMMDHDVCCKTCEAMIAMNITEWVADCNCEINWGEMAKLNASWNTKESEIGGDRANCFTELERLSMVSSSPGLQSADDMETVAMLGWAHWMTLLVSSIDRCLHCITYWWRYNSLTGLVTHHISHLCVELLYRVFLQWILECDTLSS